MNDETVLARRNPEFDPSGVGKLKLNAVTTREAHGDPSSRLPDVLLQ
jgi:hypothetical protein